MKRLVGIVGAVLLTSSATAGDMRVPAYSVMVADLVVTEIARHKGLREVNPLLQGPPAERIAINLAMTIAIHESGIALEKSDSPVLRTIGWGLKRAWIPRAGVVAWNITITF